MAPKAPKKTAGAPEGAPAPGEKATRTKLSRDERIAAFKAAGGRDYVTGEAQDALELGRGCHIVDGKLVSEATRKLKGSRTWEELRGWIRGQLDQATGAVRLAESSLQQAREKATETNVLYQSLANEDGTIRFAGEQAGAQAGGEGEP